MALTAHSFKCDTLQRKGKCFHENYKCAVFSLVFDAAVFERFKGIYRRVRIILNIGQIF